MRNIVALGLLIAMCAPVAASAFWHGTVIGVKNWDTLNVRKWPSSQSKIIGEYDNGENVSLTGRCKNIVTNQSFYIDNGNQSASWKHNRMKKPNVWCQVMTTDANLGWVRGAFVWPD